MTRLLVLALVLLTACGGPADTEVRGSLRMVGGPFGAADDPVAGVVTFVGSGGRHTARADRSGAFSIALPPGTYTVTGTAPLYGSGQGTCRADQPVTVGHTGHPSVLVACQRR